MIQFYSRFIRDRDLNWMKIVRQKKVHNCKKRQWRHELDNLIIVIFTILVKEHTPVIFKNLLSYHKHSFDSVYHAFDKCFNDLIKNIMTELRSNVLKLFDIQKSRGKIRSYIEKFNIVINNRNCNNIEKRPCNKID